MSKLRMGLPLVILTGWLAAAGCDDDRGVVDIGAGGTAGPSAGAAGETTAPGGADAGGASEGGASGATGCPVNIFGAEGKACATEGMVCGDGNDDPCQFGQSIVCRGGQWLHQEAFPAPCGGAGGEASGGSPGGAAGAGGAAGGAGGTQ